MSLNDSKSDSAEKAEGTAVATLPILDSEKITPVRRRWRDDDKAATKNPSPVVDPLPKNPAAEKLNADAGQAVPTVTKKVAVAKSAPVLPVATKSPSSVTPKNTQSRPKETAAKSPPAVAVVPISSRPLGIASRVLRNTPSWLISAVVHLVALISLSLITIGGGFISKPTTLVATIAQEADAHPIQNVEFVSPVQNNLNFDPNDISMEAIGLADVGDVADGNPTATAAAMGDIEVPKSGNAGDLFGNKDGGGKSRPNMDKYIAEFYGVKAEGKKFVFILDSSGSMRGGKFDDARRELLYSIAKLNKDQSFYVVFFDSITRPMILAPDLEPPTAPVSATVENIKRLEQWVNDTEVGAFTNPYEAVRAAVEMKPDAIYILSDGKFTDEGRTIRYLQNANIVRDPKYGRKKAKIIIHTIGFYSHEGEEALRKIAARFGGTYRFIADPNGRKR